MAINTFPFSVRVLVDNTELPLYYSPDYSDTAFAVAEVDKEFTLRFMNGSKERCLVVPTVDGLSVMDGKPGTSAGGGYIIDGHQTIYVPGWRVDDSKVANFTFSSVKDSYAGTKGDTSNVGIIGAAFFYEKDSYKIHHEYISRRYIPAGPNGVDSIWPDYDKGEKTSSLGFSESPRQHQNSTKSTRRSPGGQQCCSTKYSEPTIGTAFGKAADHQVSRVTFDRAELPACKIKIRYGTKDQLKALGVIFDEHKPDPFPADRKKVECCVPPAGWKG